MRSLLAIFGFGDGLMFLIFFFKKEKAGWGRGRENIFLGIWYEEFFNVGGKSVRYIGFFY